jgi:hypothetical protein
MTTGATLPRDRVFAALNFQPPDILPLEYHASPSGSFEHGEQLHQLWERYPQDFGLTGAFPRAAPEPRWVDAQGCYREVRRDEWGVVWEHLIFGAAGHPLERPLDDWSNLDRYQPPPDPVTSGPDFERERARAHCHQQRYFHKSGWINLFEVMIAVRRFEDVLMDIASDTPEINRLADLITDYQLKRVNYLLARGVDAIQFGDDFSTQFDLMMSLPTWRRFFKARFERLMKPVHAAGKKVFFHTCGCGSRLLEDFADLGVHAIWPQIDVYEPAELARRCREAKIAIELHPNRGELMIRSTSEQVRTAVRQLVDTFAMADGGSWFYVEIDSGFPFENVKALIETIGELRGF